MKKGVFISYSHADKDRLAPVVKLIRVFKPDLVFQDYDNLEVGKPWEPQLLEALANADLVAVFWCSHSAQSDWVKKEYQLAIQKAKDVLPIMLDDTPMPQDLSAYQGIDMRGTVAHKTKQAKHEENITYRSGHDETDEGAEGTDFTGKTNDTDLAADQQRIAVKLFDELTKRI